MADPKFTDMDKYPHGYIRSESTDIRKTFERARERIKAEQEAERKNAEERLRKTIAIKRSK